MRPEISSADPKIAELLARARADLELESLASLPTVALPQTARWLCLAPAWTPTLAARCGLPGWSEGAEVAVLDAWRDEGLVESTLSSLSIDDAGKFVPAQRLFWMPRDARLAWLSRVLAEDGRDRLVALMRDVARRIVAQPLDHQLPQATWRWATLAAIEPTATPTLRDVFERAIDEALSQSRQEDAWLWIEAMQRVADVLPGEATTLHQRAVRRLALFDRQRNDRAYLRSYLPRPAQFDAWRALLTGPDDRWALHFLGGGGVGKTMLMRALTSGTSEHFPPGFDVPPTVTARIDFDHINPDFPARRPGLLFAHLAEELRLKDESGRGAEAFALLFSKIALLHEAQDDRPADPRAVEDVLEVFALACDTVASSRSARTVLMLDTCEELARLGPDGRLPDSVQRTFALLEQLHDRLPSLRVVLCGRRPLAGTYADGEVVTPSLPACPWMSLHRVFAFSETEARTYLSRSGVPDPLVAPILARSKAAASSAALGLAAGTADERYGPFSLSVYATWVAQQGAAIDPDAILNDPVDHFVRIRILDRIHNADVRRVLPHVALLGRFDEETLRRAVDLRQDGADVIVREVVSQEWIDRQAGGYCEVEPELRARLLRHLEQESPLEVQAARRRVLPVLWESLENCPPTAAPDEPIVQSLVQALLTDPTGLFRAWRLVDARVVAGTHAAWGIRVLGRLLADDASLAAPVVDDGTWAAWVTTYAECVLREQGATATEDLWRRAWEAGQQLEPPADRAALLVRIASGGLAQAASAPDNGIAIDLWVLRLYNLLSDRHVRVTAPAELAPAIAVLMACADAADAQDDPLAVAPPMLERIAGLAAEVQHTPARAIALVCEGRFARRRQDADLARKRFLDALQLIVDAERELVPCLHWPPMLCVDRPSGASDPDVTPWVVLESLRGIAGLEPLEDTLARFSSQPAIGRSISADRLEALRLTLAGAVAVPAAVVDGLERTARAMTTSTQDLLPAMTFAHRALLPSTAVVAIQAIESGRPQVGFRMLAELTSRATSARNTTVATALRRADALAASRLRLGDQPAHARRLVGHADALSLTDREAIRVFLPATALPPVADSAAPTRTAAHALWRTGVAFDDAHRTAIAAWGRQLLMVDAGVADSEFATASVALDLVECSDLGVDGELAPRLTPASPEDWWRRHPAAPELALRLWIRSAALGVSPGGPTADLVRRVGVRRAAALAVEEGELLALRLPGQALRLLALALTWYEDAHDTIGVWHVTALLTLTRVRAGVPREGVDLGALQAAHEALLAPQAVGGPSGLLPWTTLLTSPPPLSAPPAGPDWLPWLHRVMALQQWLLGGVRPEVLFGTSDQLPLELRAWPTGGHGDSMTTTQSGIAPVDVPPPPPAAPMPPASPRPANEEAWPPPAPPSAGHPTVPGPSPASSPMWMAIQVGALVVVGLLTIALAITGAPTWAFLLAAVTLLGLLVWSVMRLQRVTQVTADVPVTWTTRVTQAPGGTAAARVSSLDVSVTMHDDRGSLVATVPMRVRRTDAFSGLDALRQPPAGTALSAPLPRTPVLQRTWLDVTVSTAWPCWEALLWTGDLERDRLQPATVRRVAAPRTARMLEPGSGGAWGVATVSASASDERQALYAWEPALRAGHVRARSIAAEAVRAGTPEPGVHVAHIVARPVDTPQGLFFEVAGGEPTQVQESLESLSTDRGTLFDASALAHAFPAASCVLVQAPRRAVLDLTPATRETCAQLRVIGAALAEQGVSVVVVLPPLDGELGAELVRLLARRLSGLRAGRTIDPHEFVARAREIALGQAQRVLPRDAAIELALQVVVYTART
ncbi:MAG TPA: hypothetical protein VMF13_22740 [Luteitalea sp.]|nr:hypothetical protein [Luteitalea sp.]